MELPHREDPAAADTPRELPPAFADSATDWHGEASDILSPPPDTPTGISIPLETVVIGDGSAGDGPTPQRSDRPDDTPPETPPTDTGRDGNKPPVEPPADRGAAEAGGGEPPAAMLVEHRDTFGNVAVSEFRRIEGGQPRSTLSAVDTAGADIGIPASYRGLVVEGRDIATGLTSEVAERDDRGRPTTVVSYDASPNPDASLRTETTLRYSDTGMLQEVVRSRKQEAAKTRYESFFDESGQRTGCIESELTDINPATGEETYGVRQVIIYEPHADGSWRETTYEGYRGGLIPNRVRERDAPPTGDVQQPFASEGRLYTRERVHAEHLPYAIIREGEQTDLLGIDDYDIPTPLRSVSLPSWIPQTAAREMAARSVPLEQLATTPHFPGTESVRVMDQDEAFRSLANAQGPQEVVNFVNELSAANAVVIQPMASRASLSRSIFDRTSPVGEHARGPLTPLQKLGILAALHPVFARQDAIVEQYSLEEAYDINTLEHYLGLLATNQQEMRATVQTNSTSLNAEARRRFGYLLRQY